jgi:hypothetical protein
VAKQEKEETLESATKIVASQGVQITPDLIALLSAAVASAVKEANRDEDAEVKRAQEERDRDMVRAEEQQRLANVKARQANCPHMDPYDHYAFCGQKNCKGEIIFLCMQCFKPFRPGDPEYNFYARYLKWDKIGSARQ